MERVAQLLHQRLRPVDPGLGGEVGEPEFEDARGERKAAAGLHHIAERAEREEDAARRGAGSFDAAQANLEARDRMDTTRTASPLQQAPDAVVIDGTELSLDEVIRAVIDALEASA